MGRVPTIRDVARACGLSHMTVSNVMNNRRVSDASRAQVLEAVRQLNYQPSAIARGLNRKPMDTIGVVLPGSTQSPMSNPYYGPILDGILAGAVELHKDVTVYTGSLWSEDGHGLARYRDGRADGLLLMTPAIQPNLVNALRDARMPFVCIGRGSESADVSWVGIDEVRCQADLVHFLLEMGHRRIALFLPEETPRIFTSRIQGYRLAMRSWEVEDESLIRSGCFTPGSVRERVEVIAATPAASRPTAICAFNDQMAILVLNELAAVGLRVPEDISVVGFDDSQGAAEAQLTTMRQPMRKIGHSAAQMLVERLRSDLPARHQLFETELIIRTTTAPPP